MTRLSPQQRFLGESLPPIDAILYSSGVVLCGRRGCWALWYTHWVTHQPTSLVQPGFQLLGLEMGQVTGPKLLPHFNSDQWDFFSF